MSIQTSEIQLNVNGRKVNAYLACGHRSRRIAPALVVGIEARLQRNVRPPCRTGLHRPRA